MNQIADVIASSYPQRFTSPHSSIEEMQVNNFTSIESEPVSEELPEAITSLITGPTYWVTAKTNRYKKLIREGHLDDLLALAEMALTKTNPANWFATVCSVKAWERTLDFLAKLHQVADKALRVATRLGTQVSRFIYKQVWSGVNVERWAVAATEVPHTKPGQSKMRYFIWLCKHEKQL